MSREPKDRRGATVPRFVPPLRGSDVMRARVPGAYAAWLLRTAAPRLKNVDRTHCADETPTDGLTA